jgi:hypothetical protein
VQGTAVGPEWLTGGSYGIEASLTGSVVIALSFGALLLLTPPRPAQAPAPLPTPSPELAKAQE